MPDLTAINYENLFCLFKGEPGTRKSGAALSFPKPMYFFSWDRKMDGLGMPMLKWGINPRDVQYDDYDDWNSVKMKLEKFRTTCPFRTLVIDSITSGSDSINRQTLRVKSGDGKGKGIAGISVNSIEDFNAEDSALKELIALLKDIQGYHKLNVILIAHVIQTDQKTPSGETHVSRQILTAGKKVAAKIPAYCSEVYHFNIKGGSMDGSGKYALLTQHTGDDFARTSLELPKEIIFGDDPLYPGWLRPAIDKMVLQTKQLNSQNTTPTTTNVTNINSKF